MIPVLAAFRMQFWSYRAYPDSLAVLITAPLFSVIFSMIFGAQYPESMAAYAIVAPTCMALWLFTLIQGGWLIQTERWAGTIELLVAAPVSFAMVIFGRILAVTLTSQLAFVEVLLVARFLLGVRVTVYHPGVLAATAAATTFAMASTALLMATTFVLARNAGTIAMSATYPFYVLGGVLVPVALLPEWLHPLSRAVFLSWSSDLLRAVFTPVEVNAVAGRLAMIVVLGLVTMALGVGSLRVILSRVRSTGGLAQL